MVRADTKGGISIRDERGLEPEKRSIRLLCCLAQVKHLQKKTAGAGAHDTDRQMVRQAEKAAAACRALAFLCERNHVRVKTARVGIRTWCLRTW